MAEGNPGGIAYTVVCLTVVVILIATVALPVIEDMQEGAVKTDKNTDTLYLMSEETSVSISYGTAGGSAIINGVEYAAPRTSGGDPLLFSDNLYIQSHNVNKVIVLYDLTKTNPVVGTLSANGEIVIENGVYSIDTTNGTLGGTVEGTLWVKNQTGTLGRFIPANMTDPGVFFDKDSFIAIGNENAMTLTNSNNESISVRGTFGGTMDTFNFMSVVNMTDSVVLDPANCSVSFSYQKVDDYTYKLISNPITISVVYDGSTYTGTLNPAKWFASMEYDTLDEDEQSNYDLLGVVAILLILVPVLMAARMIAGRRN